MNDKDKGTIQQDARIGYQAAISAWINENRQNWDKTRIMLLFNSLLLAGVLQCLLKGDKYLFIPIFLLCPLGWIICIIWRHIVRRGLEYNQYWINSAREIEELYLFPTVRTFSRGAEYADGKEVSFYLNGKREPLQMKTLKFKVKESIYRLINLIRLLYPIGIVICIYRLLNIYGYVNSIKNYLRTIL
jgi:hypothetical protein